MTVSEFGEKAMQWAEKIRAYCDKRKTCFDCPFMTHNHPIKNYPTGCWFGHSPKRWGKDS